MQYLFSGLILIAIYAHASELNITHEETNNTVYNLLFQEKLIMPHLSNRAAYNCMLTSQSWYQQVQAYRNEKVEMFNKKYPTWSQQRISCINEHRSMIYILANSVIIDASGNAGKGACSASGIMYFFSLPSDSNIIYTIIEQREYLRSFSLELPVADAITNATRTQYLCKSKKNPKSNHEEVSYGELHQTLYDDFTHESPSIKIFLDHDFNGSPQYYVTRIISEHIIYNNGVVREMQKGNATLFHWRMYKDT